VLDVCRRLLPLPSPALPLAFVVDVSLIEEWGWAAVIYREKQ
jgi:hypothetical protein